MVKKTATAAIKIMVQGPHNTRSMNEAVFNIGSNTLTVTIQKNGDAHVIVLAMLRLKKAVSKRCLL